MSDTNQTKNALARSMKHLMEKKAFEKISVSDICSECGINRKSFYYHFRDKYDLVNWIFYVGFVSEFDLDSYESGWEFLEDMCEYFYREKKFYRAALQIEGQNSFKEYLLEMLSPVTEFFLKDILPHNQDDTFFIAFIRDAFMTSVICWLSDGYEMEMNSIQYLGKIRQIIVRLADDIQHMES